MTEAFHITTGVRHGCLLSPLLFLLVVDWSMRWATEHRRNGIQWTLFTQLDNLDFTDDIALLSQNHQQMQDKLREVEQKAAETGLHISRTEDQSAQGQYKALASLMVNRRIPSHSKPCSGTHRVNVVEGDQETPGGGLSQLRCKELDTERKMWRSWHRNRTRRRNIVSGLSSLSEQQAWLSKYIHTYRPTCTVISAPSSTVLTIAQPCPRIAVTHYSPISAEPQSGKNIHSTTQISKGNSNGSTLCSFSLNVCFPWETPSCKLIFPQSCCLWRTLDIVGLMWKMWLLSLSNRSAVHRLPSHRTLDRRTAPACSSCADMYLGAQYLTLLLK